MVNEERDLLERAKTGDEQAFAKLIQTYTPRVTAVVGSVLGYSSAVQDVVQDVFFKFFRSISMFDGRSKLSTYLISIALHESIDHQRREKKHGRDVDIDKANNVLKRERWNENLATKLALAEQVAQGMTPLQQEIVRLYCWEEYQAPEVAKMLGIKPGLVFETVKTFRKRLKQREADLSPKPPSPGTS